MNKVYHFARRYIDISIDEGIFSANNKAFHLLLKYFWSKIDKILSYKWEIQLSKNTKVLFIESTKVNDWMWLWDWIFKTSLLNCLWENKEIDLSIACYRVRKAIFNSVSNLNDIYLLNWGLLNLIAYWIKLRKTFEYIVYINPSFRMVLLRLLLWSKAISWHISSNQIANSNHIEMYKRALECSFPFLSSCETKTKIDADNDLCSKYMKIIQKKQWFTYIWINIWAEDSLRNFKDWDSLIWILNKEINNIIFVLYWNSNTFNINENLKQKFENVLDFVWKTTSIEEVYSLISLMDINIWADWWNINASVALWKETIIIYSNVVWKNRVPLDFDSRNMVQWDCHVWPCHATTMWSRCIINWQRKHDHQTTPPCLLSDTLVKQVSNRINELISNP